MAGLVLQTGCAPQISPEEKRIEQAEARRQLTKQQNWSAYLQALGQQIEADALYEVSLRFDVEFDGNMPAVFVECRGMTNRQAKQLADIVAQSYFQNFPDDDKFMVFVDDWDSLEELYHDVYKRNP